MHDQRGDTTKPSRKSGRRQAQPKKLAPFRKLPGESWSQTRNRGARELGFADYTEYRLTQGRKKGKSIQAARGHGGPSDRREKPAKRFRPGKRAAAIYAPQLREATTTRTPAYVFDLLPYPSELRMQLVPAIVSKAHWVKRKHGRVAYRFLRYGTRYKDDNEQPQYYYGDTVLLSDRASWKRFRADLVAGIAGVLSDPIAAVWFYGLAR